MEWLQWVHGSAEAVSAPAFGPGDDVRVWFRILEQGKERLGQFEGTVIRSRGSQASRSFTVRRVTHGEGVERVFPMGAKVVSKIDVLRRGKVHRARLYFLRKTVGKTRIAAAGGDKTALAGDASRRDAPSPAPETAAVAAEPPAGSVSRS